ncbi:MAG: hypothetical protein CMD11_02455 [Flavobacteriales bacterium]|nr:hypothetical protein [Flavobacteriales bacterium]
MSSFNYEKSLNSNINNKLILLLHGYGSNEDDLFSFKPFIPKSFDIYSLRAPISIGFGYAWFNINFDNEFGVKSEKSDVLNAKKYIESFLEIHSKNYKNIYLIGFSQGAMLSYLVGLTNNFVSGIGCLSGWVDTRFSNFTNKTSNIYASHGKNDTVVPYDIAIKSVDLLSNLGFNINFNSFDSGHGVNQKNLDSLITWLNNLNT